MSFARFAALALASLGLAACNSTRTEMGAEPQRAVQIAGVPPQGAGCRPVVDRFQGVITNENNVGQVGSSVYKQVEDEIAQADTACRAGRDSEASAMIRASRARHGYPAG